MKRLIGNLLGLAVIAAIAAFFAAPAVAYFAVRSAAESNDVEALARLIDYPAVRQGLRPQLDGRPEAMEPAPTFLEDPIGAVRRQLEQTRPVEGPQPDAYLTPAALSGLMRAEGRYAAQRGDPTAGEPEEVRGPPLPKPIYWGVNRARFAVEDEGGSRTIFSFQRTGPYDWRLTHIGLPDGANPVAAPPAPGAPAAPTPPVPAR